MALVRSGDWFDNGARPCRSARFDRAFAEGKPEPVM